MLQLVTAVRSERPRGAVNLLRFAAKKAEFVGSFEGPD